jgi:DNA-binding YbaB/EbfC family protein
MFNKLKQFKQARDKAKDMKSELEEEEITVSKGGLTGGNVEITINGNMDIVDIDIDEDLLDPSNKSSLEKYIKKAHEKATKKMQKKMAKKMKDMGGMPDIPGLS